MASIIDNLTGFADQVSELQLPDQTVASMELIYNGTTERWVLNLIYNGVSYNSIGLCCFPNVLRAWRKILPFGIACVTSDGTDPFDINDFTTGRVTLFLLTSAEVQQVETELLGSVAA